MAEEKEGKSKHRGTSQALHELHLLTFHWVRKVTKPNLKPRGRKVDSVHCEVKESHMTKSNINGIGTYSLPKEVDERVNIS